MRILIIGGRAKTDYLISMLKDKHEIEIMNDDEDYCHFLSDKYDVPSYVVNLNYPSKIFLDLEDSYDAAMVLTPNDCRNLIICQFAKKHNINKTITIVHNPLNQNFFKKLGVDIAISSTYFLAEKISTSFE